MKYFFVALICLSLFWDLFCFKVYTCVYTHTPQDREIKINSIQIKTNPHIIQRNKGGWRHNFSQVSLSHSHLPIKISILIRRLSYLMQVKAAYFNEQTKRKSCITCFTRDSGASISSHKRCKVSSFSGISGTPSKIPCPGKPYSNPHWLPANRKYIPAIRTLGFAFLKHCITPTPSEGGGCSLPVHVTLGGHIKQAFTSYSFNYSLFKNGGPITFGSTFYLKLKNKNLSNSRR